MTGRWTTLGGVALGSVALGVASSGCTAASHGGTHVELIAAAAALAPGEALSTASGDLVTLDALYWTTAEVELQRCSGAWTRIGRALLPEAHAHGSASPTRMATPTVQSAYATVDVSLAAMSPPAGEYCAVHYVIAPADDDAIGVDAVPEMVGSSVVLRGRVHTQSNTTEAFQVHSQSSIDVQLDLDLELSSEHDSATLRLVHDPERWLMGIDVTEASDAARERAALEAFRSALRVQVE